MSELAQGLCFWNGLMDKGIFDGYYLTKEVKEMWDTGIVIIEAQSTPAFPNQPPMSVEPPIYPTSSWLVLSPDSGVFSVFPNYDIIMAERRLVLSPDLFVLLQAEADKQLGGPPDAV